MIDFAPEILALLNARTGVKMRVLWWLSAKNRVTDETETIGIWNGEDHQEFVIGGETRMYYGAGDMLDIGILTSEASLNIRRFDITFTALSPEMQLALRQYEPKFAPVQVHVAFFDPETNNLVAAPHRMLKGWIDKAPIKTPAKGGTASSTVSMVGHTRMLTKRLAAKRSNENQRRRAMYDGFFVDVTMTGKVQTPWGSGTVQSGAGRDTNRLARRYGVV